MRGVFAALCVLCFAAPMSARAQGSCDYFPQNTATELLDCLGPVMPPPGLTLAGERAYTHFLLSLEPRDLSTDSFGRWTVTSQSKIVDLLLDLPLTDWSPQLYEFTASTMRRHGIEVREDASINSLEGELVDSLEGRIERALGETKFNILRVTLGLAYGLEHGGRVRLYQKRWSDHSRLKFHYRWDPDGDDRPSLSYEYRPADRMSLDVHLEEDAFGLGYQQRLQHGGTIAVSATDDYLQLWYRVRY